MQQLLHEAITREQNHCCGLLMGKGNVVTNSLPVTDKLFPATSLASDDDHKEVILGAYLATDVDGQIDLETIAKMAKIAAQFGHQKAFYYLILYLDHKGRIDAYMYADPELNSPVTLSMREDCTL